MRASLAWLRRLCPAIPADAHLVADRLTMAGYVVASVESFGDDFVLDVEVTYNRPDLLSHVGIARELAGVFGGDLVSPETAVRAGVASAETLPVAVEAGDLCPLYTARIVRGVRVGPSPAWLVQALEAAGQRSVNDVVDVTNYVMLLLGQPLHAFDLAKLRGPAIVVRRGRGESLTAIDGKKLLVPQDDLAICDAQGPVALAGVMGGLDSEVSTSTRDLVLESAVFAPLAIRATSRRHGLRSESSFRFERFVDPAGVRAASDLAARLFVEVCGATAVGPVVEAGPGAPAHGPRIELRTARVAHVLGVAVDVAEIRGILASLGLGETPSEDARITVWTAPSWRPDLVAEIDLIEEIGRRVGFDRVPEREFLGVRPRVVDRALDVRRRVRDALVRAGLRECVSAPFVGAGPLDLALLVAKPALRVLNPMRTGEDLLRRSLVGPLLATARRNRERDVPDVRIFETAPAYVPGAKDGEVEEIPLVAGVVSGAYADAKGCVEHVLDALGLGGAEFVRGAPRPLRGDRGATVRVDGRDVAVVGELSPRGVEKHGLAGPTAVFEMRLDLLTAAARLEREYVRISRFPAVERDLAWVVADEVPWADLERAARDAGAPLVRSVRFLSVFRGAQVGAGRKSVAFRMELRADDRTLTGDEADRCVRDVIARLEADTGGTLRA